MNILRKIRQLRKFIDDQFPSIVIGRVLEIREHSISVSVPFRKEGGVNIPDSLLINNKEISFIPEVNSEVIVAFLEKRFDKPIIIGTLNSGLNFIQAKDEVKILNNISVNKGKDEVNISGNKISLNNNIVLNKTTQKVYIGNSIENLTKLLQDILVALITLGSNLTSATPFPIPNMLIADASKILTKLPSLFDNIDISSVDSDYINNLKAELKNKYKDMVKQYEIDNPDAKKAKADAIKNLAKEIEKIKPRGGTSSLIHGSFNK